MNLEPPKGNLDTSKTYKAKIDTEKGEIVIPDVLQQYMGDKKIIKQ